MADDKKNDTAGQVIWEPGKAAPAVPARSPVEAAAFLAQALASGRIRGVHLTLFTHDGQMTRVLFGEIYLPMLAWMAAYVTRDALAMNDGATPPNTQLLDPATGRPKTP